MRSEIWSHWHPHHLLSSLAWTLQFRDKTSAAWLYHSKLSRKKNGTSQCKNAQFFNSQHQKAITLQDSLESSCQNPVFTVLTNRKCLHHDPSPVLIKPPHWEPVLNQTPILYKHPVSPSHSERLHVSIKVVPPFTRVSNKPSSLSHRAVAALFQGALPKGPSQEPSPRSSPGSPAPRISAHSLQSQGPCRWHHSYGRKQKGIKEPLDEGERGEWKSWLKTQHSKN